MNSEVQHLSPNTFRLPVHEATPLGECICWAHSLRHSCGLGNLSYGSLSEDLVFIIIWRGKQKLSYSHPRLFPDIHTILSPTIRVSAPEGAQELKLRFKPGMLG